MAEPRALCCSTICTAALLSVLGLNLRSIAAAALLVQGAIKKANAGGMYHSAVSLQRATQPATEANRDLGVILFGSVPNSTFSIVLTDCTPGWGRAGRAPHILYSNPRKAYLRLPLLQLLIIHL